MDTLHHVNNQKCFVSTLSRLRESSKEAVVSADEKILNPYAKYMHVNRPVQEKFEKILKNTYNTAHAELILLCGSVGDGKSHMLSYFKTKHPEMMEKFYVHNDSTASLFINESAAYTLKTLMEDFSDDKILDSKRKVILAINLGTLSNFLEADTEKKFEKLRRYVENVGILDTSMNDKGDSDYFHSVNFADYHLYELTPNGINSNYIKGLLSKITAKDEENIFYTDYCEMCYRCQSKENCPVKVNYELISDSKIQKGIISALVEGIVKNKLIVSTRMLLNMIYEILVDERYWNRGSLEPRKEPERLTKVSYCEALLPNVLFGKRNSSKILDSMGVVDPLQLRNENIDDFFIYYENSDNIVNIFKEDLGNYFYTVNCFEKLDFKDNATHSIKESILKLFVRTCWLIGTRRDLLPNDEDYEEYIRALYAWNTGKYRELKSVYNIVEKGILSWNGQAEKDEMQLSVSNKKSQYHLMQKIEIKQKVDNLPKKNQEILEIFRDELRLKYRYLGEHEAELDVDFTLYKLLKKVSKGYVPNMNDKRVNVKCAEFINCISQGGKKMERLYIRDFSQKEPKNYVISFEEDFGYSFEVN